MKKTLFAASLLALLIPLAASAHHTWHRQSITSSSTTTTIISKAPVAQTVAVTEPLVVQTLTTAPSTSSPVASPVSTSAATLSLAPSPTVPPATQSGLCMNYGYQPTAGGQYDFTQVDSNLAVLKQAGITCLRLGYNGFNNPNTEALALHAKTQGFSILMGGDWGTLDQSQLASYDAQALAQAAWEQQNGIGHMSLGNEQEVRLSGISLCQWRDHLQALAAQVHQVYSGTVSYDIDGDYIGQYISCGGIGTLDSYGFNLYGGEQFNAQAIQQGLAAFGAGHVYVAEIDCDVGNPQTGCSDDATHAAELQSDLLVLKKTFAIPFYYFNFSSGGTAPQAWGLYSGSTLAQPLTAAVLGIK